ncbi:HAD family hydrolase [Anaerosporobacter sp.]|uniref:HAD family hydrolase n=1 Tax=Anaerosporobacter sp. TaxID=1872529 RepID=UPI00286EF09B|nr:HAD family hydrolase [Anaerosporobacter sp.]
MRIKGVLFDKDGTLIDFFSLWLKAATEVIPKLMKELSIDSMPEMKEYLLNTIGVRDGAVDPNGGLSYKSYGEIAEDIKEALAEKDVYVDVSRTHKLLVKLFEEFATGENVQFQTFTPMKEMLTSLKREGIYVGLATADTLHSARVCLEKLDILEMFDFVGGDDGIMQPKPHPEMFDLFTQRYKLQPEEVAIVGDTPNDMLFAKQCGAIAIGVLSGVSNKEDLMENGDYIISSVDELLSLLHTI